jgi:hypothetical protein
MADITTKYDPNDPNDPHQHDAPDDVNPNVAYEHGDADLTTVTKYTVALIFGVFIAATAMYGLFNYFNGGANSDEAVVPQVIRDQRPKLPPEPRLQATPKLYIKDLKTAEKAQIESFGWVDQKNGIVRIPIEVAVDAVAQAGLPSRPVKADVGLDKEGYRSLPSVASSGRTVERIR